LAKLGTLKDSIEDKVEFKKSKFMVIVKNQSSRLHGGNP
jgi:putative IMPACT (imprinted ancient) family translation regulator